MKNVIMIQIYLDLKQRLTLVISRVHNFVLGDILRELYIKVSVYNKMAILIEFFLIFLFERAIFYDYRCVLILFLRLREEALWSI